MESLHDRRVRQAPPVYTLLFPDPPFAGWTFLVFRHAAGGYYCTAHRPAQPHRLSGSVGYNTRPQPSVRWALAAAQEWVAGFTAELDGGAA